MSDAPPMQCPKCGAPVVCLQDDNGKPLLIWGREKWVCKRYEDDRNRCDYKSLRHPVEQGQAACPHCGCCHLLDDKVTHSQIKGASRRRRRICRNCGLSVFTLEVVEPVS